MNFPILVPAITGVPNTAGSSAPNPYTSADRPSRPLGLHFLNPQSFQIISSGIDGQYGVGGQYTPDATGEALPLDTSSPGSLQHERHDHPGPRAGQRHQFPQRQAGMTISAFL